MIKLENPTNAPVAFGVLTVQSIGDNPSIVLGTKPVDRPPPANAPAGSRWEPDPTKALQTLVFLGADGTAVELSGVVPESAAVTISGAFRVLAEVRPSNRLRGAYAKGSISKEDAVLELVKVQEVWVSPTKCIYGPGMASGKPSAKAMDMATGRVV